MRPYCFLVVIFLFVSFGICSFADEGQKTIAIPSETGIKDAGGLQNKDGWLL